MAMLWIVVHSSLAQNSIGSDAHTFLLCSILLKSMNVIQKILVSTMYEKQSILVLKFVHLNWVNLKRHQVKR